MRFSISKKVILVGAGVSFLLMLFSFLISFLVYQNNAKKNLIEGVDSSLNEIDLIFTDYENVVDIVVLRNRFLECYNEVADEELPKFSSNDEEYNYYYERYNFIYYKPIPGSMGMIHQKEKAIYMEFSGYLASAVISSRGISAYFCYFDKTRNRYVYMIDSSYRFDTYNGSGHLLGSYHVLDSNDKIVANPDEMYDSYEFNGQKTRYVDVYYQNNNQENEYLGTLFIEYSEGQLYSALSSFFIIESISLSVALIVLIIIYIILLRIFLLKNLYKLDNATKLFTNNILSNSTLEIIDPNVKASDEIGDISKSFVLLEKEIIEYTKRIEFETKEKEKINAELAVASKIQLEALPHFEFIDNNLTLNASITSAKEVGGDFYDYFYIDDNKFAVIISDVSGKGIPASLFMMKCKALIKTKLLSKMNLEDLCFSVNNELLENNDEGLFITAFISIYNTKTDELEFINCGHEKPFLVGDKIEKLESNSNFILGGVKDFKYKCEKISLKNRKLFLYTDGLNESINSSREEFSYDRIASTLDINKNESNENILINMKNALDLFTEGNEQFDDITMVIFNSNTKELLFEYKNPGFEAIDITTKKINNTFNYLDKKLLSEIGIIIDEMLNNYISYEKKENLIINVNLLIKDDYLYITLMNNGLEFNPLELPTKYYNNESEISGIGGFGITIVRNLVDDIKYSRENNKNVLKIKKKI